MIVIAHCSDSEYGNAVLIDKWHRERGFNKIGYHFVVLNGRIDENRYNAIYDGLIETGRHFKEKGAHTKGQNDKIAICLVGKSGQFTPKQMESLYIICRVIEQTIFGGEYVVIGQHSDYDSKNKLFCAGLNLMLVNMEYREYIKKINW